MCFPDFYGVSDVCVMVQDTVDGGKRGSRTQCVEAAQAALTAGAQCHTSCSAAHAMQCCKAQLVVFLALIESV